MTVLGWLQNLWKLFSSIPKHMIILYLSETDQRYSVLFEKIWQSDVDDKLIKATQFYSKTYDNLTLIRNLSKLFSSIPKDMRILHWPETYQSYSVLFQKIWESYTDWKLIKAIQFYSKTYDNLTLIGNLSKLFSSIPNHMTMLCWWETYQSYSVLFQNIWQSYVERETYQSYTVLFEKRWQSYIDRKLIKAIQFYLKTYANLTLIGKLIKGIEFYLKTDDNLTFIGNLSKLFSSIPKHMRTLPWSETYQRYSVLFKNIWQSYIAQKFIKGFQFSFKIDGNLTLIGKLIKAIQFHFKIYDNLTLIRSLSELLSSIRKHMIILRWSGTYQTYAGPF